MKSCPNCGAPLPGDTNQFCMNCGTELPAMPLAPSAPSKEEGATQGKALFTPAFAAESGTPIDFSVPRDSLPTGKEAEEILRRALADAGAPIFSPALTQKAPPPGAASALAAKPVSQPPVEPSASSAEEFSLFGAESVTLQPPPADLFAGGSTAEFSIPGSEGTGNEPEHEDPNGMPEQEPLAESRQVFPARQQATQQTIPYESQQSPQNLFNENSGRPQQHPQQGQAQQQRHSLEQQADARRAPSQENRAAMAANIAQAVGTEEGATRDASQERRPRPMAAGGTPRPAAPTQRAPSRPAPRRPMEEARPPHRQKNTGKLVRNVLLIVLFFLIATFVATMGLLYFRGRPAAIIDTFAEAVAARDYTTLADIVSLNEAPPTNEGWTAFCDAFEQEGKLDALKTQLAGKPSSEDDVSGLTYQAVTLESDPIFLFINKYYVRITGIELLAPGAAEGAVLNVMGADHSGTPTQDGVLYGKFMPGRYTCQLTPRGGTPAAALEMEAFSVTAPNRIEGEGTAATAANVTVENCLSDDAVLYVNNSEVAQKPQNGEVKLENVPLNAEIKIIATENGARSQSTVLFADASVTNLRFENYTPVEGEEDTNAKKIAEDATPEQINQALATFYTSYLDCINAQDIGRIKLSTEKNNANIVGRISNAANAANTYSYVSADAKTDSIVAGEENGAPSLKLNGTFEYTYAPRDAADNVQRGSNRQSIHLLYVNNQWVVDGFVFVEDADYNNNVIAGF